MSRALQPVLYNVTLTLADTEYSQALTNCSRVCFQARSTNVIRFAFVSGKVAGPTAPYMTLKSGDTFDSGEVFIGGATIYFASTDAGTVVELEVWS